MQTATTPALRLTPEVALQLRTAWRASRDVEPCGYLLGTRGGREDVASRAVPGRNVHVRPATSFALRPDEQLAVRQLAARLGLELLAIWHGHLAGPPVPSGADRTGHGRCAPRWMVIAGRDADGGCALRAYFSSSPRTG